MYGRKKRNRGVSSRVYGLQVKGGPLSAKMIVRSFDAGRAVEVRGLPPLFNITPGKVPEPLPEYEVPRSGWPQRSDQPGLAKGRRPPTENGGVKLSNGSNGSVQTVSPQPQGVATAPPRDNKPSASEKTNPPTHKPIPDDVLMSDIQSILNAHSQKPAEPRQNVPDGKNRAQNGVSQSQTAGQERQTKNEHAIFDRIAQSMEKARAYDLGSVELQQRFNDFDHAADAAKTEQMRRPTSPTPSPSKVAEQTSTADFIQDLDRIKEKKGRAFEQEAIPLDPGIGGRSIATEVLLPADIILSTTDTDLSKNIRAATGSPVSHAALYIGDNKIVEVIEEGVILRSLDTALKEDSLAVAYRHRDLTPQKAEKVVDFVTQKAREKVPFDKWGLIRTAPGQLVRAICNKLPEALRQDCLDRAKTLRVGTDDAGAFYCSELVLKALEAAGLSLSNIDPSWSSAGQILDLQLNELLEYVGHLKV